MPTKARALDVAAAALRDTIRIAKELPMEFSAQQITEFEQCHDVILKLEFEAKLEQNQGAPVNIPAR